MHFLPLITCYLNWRLASPTPRPHREREGREGGTKRKKGQPPGHHSLNHLGLPLAAGSYTTVAGDDADVPGNIKIDTKITSLGLFAKLYTKASDDLELFGRLGMSSINMTAEASTTNSTATAKASDKSTAWGYGVGVKYKVGSSTSVVFDYTGYNKQSSSTVGLGVAYAF